MAFVNAASVRPPSSYSGYALGQVRPETRRSRTSLSPVMPAPLGPSYSATSLVSAESGPSARAPPRSAGSVLGQGQVLQAPPAPPSVQPVIALQGPLQAEQMVWPPDPTGRSVPQPVPLFGRTLRSSPGSTTSLQGAAQSSLVMPAPVAKPMWVIEEVIDFDVEEKEEDPDLDDFGRVCQSRFFPASLLEGCMLWNCSEDDEMAGEVAEMVKDDQEMSRVNRIAEALGLECIGWVFTSLPLEDGLLLSPEEVVRIARLQNDHSTDKHFTKYTLSKFVSCAVRPDPAHNGAPGINPFMVSEQACSMLRDGILTSTPSERRACVVREAGKDEMIPDFVCEGRSSKKIATDFFIVRVNDTAPKKHQRLLTHAEFPRENRPTHPQRREDLKKFFSKIPKSEPSWSRFADFHLLLYIAKEIDVDTAVTIAECVRDRKDIPEGVTMIFNELTQ
ncbi:unnamed protein product [Symbiodinium sp. CCMP2456]|nr:unnamed protein product [Symbiodinium sp. CCMP2456]